MPFNINVCINLHVQGCKRMFEVKVDFRVSDWLYYINIRCTSSNVVGFVRIYGSIKVNLCYAPAQVHTLVRIHISIILDIGIARSNIIG